MNNLSPKNKKRINLKLFFFVLLFFLGVFAASHAEAATLYFSPSSGNFTAGNVFTVSILVNTESVAINNAEAIINFPSNLLEIISVSKSGSIFSLWVEEPTFSNSAGTISFNGGLPTPGFNGTAGKILGITFRVKKVGSATLVFSSAAVRANDGYGTNVFKSGVQALFNLIAEEGPLPPPVVPPTVPPTEEVPPTIPTRRPAAPVVSSPTHPDENKWYSNNDPEFIWQLPQDVTKVSYAIDRKPTTNPKFIAETLVNRVSFSDLEDGIWYFHINFRNSAGWGALTHRKVLIDTVPPLPFEIEVQREDPTDPRPVLKFQTTDELSGLDYYEMKIGEGDNFPVSVEEIKHNPYLMPLQAWGKHPIEVRAFDKARNYTLATTEIEVSPIKGVEITKIPRSIRLGESLVVEGKGEPGITVRIYIQRLGKEPILEKVKADSAGKFILSYDKALAKDDYIVWAQAEDDRGALSLPTKKYSLEVGLPPFLKFGKIVLDYLTTMITLIILIVGAIAVIFYTWYRISIWRKRVRKETGEVKESVNRAFNALREKVEEQVSMLDKKPGLSKSEKEIRDKLKEALDISEASISKEIKDVEKELE